jgi:ankyrin repeat protein
LERAQTHWVESGNTILHALVCLASVSSDVILKGGEAGVALDFKNALGQTPFYLAVACGNVHAAHGLLQLGADPNEPNQSGNTPLHHVMEQRNFEMAEFLVRPQARPSSGLIA